jgi:hypothetical protein
VEGATEGGTEGVSPVEACDWAVEGVTEGGTRGVSPAEAGDWNVEGVEDLARGSKGGGGGAGGDGGGGGGISKSLGTDRRTSEWGPPASKCVTWASAHCSTAAVPGMDSNGTDSGTVQDTLETEWLNDGNASDRDTGHVGAVQSS